MISKAEPPCRMLQEHVDATLYNLFPLQLGSPGWSPEAGAGRGPHGGGREHVSLVLGGYQGHLLWHLVILNTGLKYLGARR